MSSRSSSAIINLAVFAAGFVTFINMWCTQSLLPILAAAFHVSESQIGLTVTAPLIGTAAMAPLIGAISDRFGRKRLITGAAFLLFIPTLGAAFSTSLNEFVLCRFIQGLTLPFIFTITIAYIGEETTGPATSRMAGIYTSGAISGGFSGRVLSGIITQAASWQAALLTIAGLSLAMAVLITLALPKEKHFRPLYGISRALASFPRHLSNPKLLATYTAGFGVLFCLVAVFTFINFRLAAAPYHLGPAALGEIFVVYLSGVIMTPIAGRLAARFGLRPIMAAATATILAGLAISLAAPLPLILLGLTLICGGIFIQQTLATSFVSQVAREAKSTAVGLYVTFYYIGGSCGGFFPGSAWHEYGWLGCAGIVAGMQSIMFPIAMRFWVQK
jgi:predicted MFS family arabinose efflux permease